MLNIENIFRHPKLLSEIGKQERARLRDLGVPIYWSENGRHIEQQPDGTCRYVKIDPSGTVVPAEFIPAEDAPQVKPTFCVIAGPNGSGKSSFASTQPLPSIDADAIAAELRPDAPLQAAFAAGREASRRVGEYLRQGQSFCRETTLAGATIIKLMQRVKQSGYHVLLLYMGLDCIGTSQLRVMSRAAAGGHDVPLADLQRRYPRSLANLARAVALADASLIFDNSRSYLPLAEIQHGNFIQLAKVLPEWLLGALPDFVGSVA